MSYTKERGLIGQISPEHHCSKTLLNLAQERSCYNVFAESLEKAEEGNAYPESSALVGAAESVWEGSESRVTICISASEKLRVEMQKTFGLSLENVFITDSDIRHIKKRHGSSELLRGQCDICPRDFACLPAVLNEFDEVSHTDTDKLGNKKFLFSKEMDGAVYVATVQRGKKSWKSKLFGRGICRVPRADLPIPLGLRPKRPRR